MDTDTDDVDAKVERLLALIEEEKRQPKPNRNKMYGWFKKIEFLKQDWRVTYTGQNSRFIPRNTD